MEQEKNTDNRKPMVLVIAGPNGSGKSTLMGFFEKQGTYTNADDVAASTGMSVEEAARYVDRIRFECIERREDFTFETVLSSDYKIALLKKAKENGFFLKCFFILTADVNINLSRVEARVASGGHAVPEEKIKDRYRKSLNNIKVLLEICDILHVYDNTGAEPYRIIRKHKDDLTIFPNEDWTEKDIDDLLALPGENAISGTD